MLLWRSFYFVVTCRSQRSSDKSREKARQLAAENRQLKERIALLEALPGMPECRLSASLQEYLHRTQITLY
jgi:hypothetical protein